MPELTLARLPTRIQARITPDFASGCWWWDGPLHHGYGSTYFARRNWRVHRLTYFLLIGEIPEGKELDHLCRVRHCVNPAHLEPVTQVENTLRGVGVTAVNARKTSCVHGHAEDGWRVRKDRVGRDCRQCNIDRLRGQRTASRLGQRSGEEGGVRVTCDGHTWNCRFDKPRSGPAWRCGYCLRGLLGPYPEVGAACRVCGALVVDAGGRRE